MQIDFQDFNLNQIKAENDFERDVLNFINDWFSDSKIISVKTSGSTGDPKIIKVDKEKMRNSAKMTCDFLDLKEGNSAILCLPVEYISGKMMVVRAIERKMKLIVANTSLHPFENFNKKADFCALTPLQVENSFDGISNIEKLIIGGAKVSDILKEKIQKKLQENNSKTEVFETFGMSETLSHIALRKLAPVEEPYFTVFRGINISIDNRNCLQISAPSLNSDILQTNDIVEIKSDNHFKFIGRADFIINSGGLKISPEVLEKLVKKSIDSELVFIGIPDINLGEKLVLVIEGGEAQSAILEKLKTIEFPSKNHKPKEVFFLKLFPRTETGKILRLKVKNTIENLLK
jgi:O-succinylbenzoic acid--CoA ligase